MKTMPINLICLICLLAVSAQGAAPGAFLWTENFETLQQDAADPGKGWVAHDASAALMAGNVRLRKTGDGTEGRLTRLFAFDCRKEAGFRYLQVRAGAIERIEHFAALSLKLGEEGSAHTVALFTGITTVDLHALGFAGRTGKLEVSLVVHGDQGKSPGGWADVDWLRLGKTADAGLLMELVESGKANQTAEIGDRVRLSYVSEPGLLEEPPVVKCFTYKNMIPFRFTGDQELTLRDDGQDGDRTAGDGVFSRQVTIDTDALGLTKPRPASSADAIIAWVQAAEEDTYAYNTFALDIKAKEALPNTWATRGGLTPRAQAMRLRWHRLTSTGENLALGRPVRFSIPSDYSLTKKGDTDHLDLTDGTLSSIRHDKIWFASNAVAWRMPATEGINMVLDLGKVQPIGRIAARILGGAEQGSLLFPRRIQAVVSLDGKTFYRVAALEKLMPGEKDQADWEKTFYLPENGKAYVYPFEMKLQTKGRFVGLRIVGQSGFLALDEIAVFKGDFAAETVSLSPADQAPVIMDGIAFGPLKNEFYISTNILTPNILLTTDCRQGADRKKPVTYIIEVPRAVTLASPTAPETVTIEPFDDDGTAMNRIRFGKKPPWLRNWKIMGPLYFQIDPETPLPSKPTACFYALCDGVAPNRTTMPLVPLAIPKVPKLKRLHVSLAWMGTGHSRRWPEFFTAWQHLGFNALSTFPRYWKNQVSEELAEHLREARRHGMKIVYNESPFHVMKKKHRKNSEIYSQFADGTHSKHTCPSYRGDAYNDEIKRVGDCFELTRAEYVFYDIELWYHGANEATRCTRCQEKLAKSGKPLNEFLTDCGTEMLRDMRREIAARARKLGLPMPIVGHYNTYASRPLYHKVYDFAKAHPQWIDISMPSLYCQGDSLKVHNTIRDSYEIMRRRANIPWLSTGCYGDIVPKTAESMLLETFLNGSSGVTYYCFQDFDTPAEYYYHAKALALLAPFEDLLADGGPTHLVGSNPLLTYSAYAHPGGEMLLLVGNYQRTPDGKAEITLPYADVAAIRELRKNKDIRPEQILRIDVPPGEIALYHIRSTQ
ncbi:MAG: hypothetical protein KAI66_04050 [Lentisphaeria bacterium]|nr:hypothetical protein [Lentisphaeria bacterium]